MGAPKIDLTAKIWTFLAEHGLHPSSKSLVDYEFAKNVLFLKAYYKFAIEYENFIRIITKYLEI